MGALFHHESPNGLEIRVTVSANRRHEVGRLGRARQAVVDMRRLLSPYLRRGIPAVASLDAQAAAYPVQVL